jgi:hypothetical protein
MTSCIELPDLAKQNFRTRATCGKARVSLSAVYRQICRKVQLAISHCEKVEPKSQRKLATSIRQKMPQGSADQRSSKPWQTGFVNKAIGWVSVCDKQVLWSLSLWFYCDRELVLITLESKPPQYRLRVKAKTGSGGISNPQLLETTGPKDKFKNLELVVDVPSMGTAMVTTVAYNFYLGYNSGGHIGVRVLAQDNDKTVLFEEASQSLMGIGDAFPWSHPSGPNKDLQLNDVVGRVVRVGAAWGLGHNRC